MLLAPTIQIRRERMTADAPTRGVLTVLRFATPEVLFRCHTLEPPWKNNERRVSCIPAGTYTARFLPTSKFPDLARRAPWYKNHLWELIDVAGRSEVKFHHGTEPRNTEGCPLLGFSVTKTGINNSVEALRQFHAILSQFELGQVTVNVFELATIR